MVSTVEFFAVVDKTLMSERSCWCGCEEEENGLIYFFSIFFYLFILLTWEAITKRFGRVFRLPVLLQFHILLCCSELELTLGTDGRCVLWLLLTSVDTGLCISRLLLLFHILL